MGGDSELPQADRGTEIESKDHETPSITTELKSQKDLRGSARRHAEFAKFMRENPDYDFRAEDIRKTEMREAAEREQRQGKETYFFYGTLMDPGIAQEVLGLDTPPTMRPAMLKKFGHLKMWGPFPAFRAAEKPRLDVKGMACEIEGAERKDRLAAYEGEKYIETFCLINVLSKDGSAEFVAGKVFKWIGGDDDLKDGTFDLEAYKA